MKSSRTNQSQHTHRFAGAPAHSSNDWFQLQNMHEHWEQGIQHPHRNGAALHIQNWLCCGLGFLLCCCLRSWMSSLAADTSISPEQITSKLPDFQDSIWKLWAFLLMSLVLGLLSGFQHKVKWHWATSLHPLPSYLQTVLISKPRCCNYRYYKFLKRPTVAPCDRTLEQVSLQSTDTFWY